MDLMLHMFQYSNFLQDITFPKEFVQSVGTESLTQ